MVDDDPIPMPEDLSEIIETASIRSGKRGLHALVDLIVDERNRCVIRGYHRIDEEPQNPNPHNKMDMNNLLICYDCEAFFGKYDDIAYKVEKM